MSKWSKLPTSGAAVPAVFQSHRRQLRGGIYPRQLRRQVGRGDPTLGNGLATLTPARPDCNGTGPVPAYFFSVLQSGFLAHACSMPACLHQNFEGKLKES